MPKCEYCNFSYEIDPPELQVCDCGARSAWLREHPECTEAAERCHYPNREDKCDFFEPYKKDESADE